MLFFLSCEKKHYFCSNFLIEKNKHKIYYELHFLGQEKTGQSGVYAQP